MTHEYRTKSGKLLTSEDIQRLADEAERGYDLEKLRGRHTTHDTLLNLPCWNALRLEVDGGIVDDVIERVSAVFAERERVLRERIVLLLTGLEFSEEEMADVLAVFDEC